ncbi:hypothetical protein LCGC14_2301920 [marine sediment metagenome]|uniref:Uncharacterized protein n=1 Tax=marine sediment metagenome TaxID=412755 RepID=A0A0F9F0P1_9ZZZZ
MESRRDNLWNCDYCVSKNLQQTRNCGEDIIGECQKCGSFKEEECFFDEENGRHRCPNCNGKMRWPLELRLGRKWLIHCCPIRIINPTTIFLIKLVSWSETVGVLPALGGLLDQTNFYFEIRNIVVSERNIAEEELKPQEATPGEPQAGGVVKIPKKAR